MKKLTKQPQKKRYFDFHLRLSLETGNQFIAECKNNRRKYSDQMALILENRYQQQSEE